MYSCCAFFFLVDLIKIAQLFGGASTSENTCTKSGRRAPRTSIAATARFSSVSSSGVKFTASEPIFSNICAICVVPGIGTIHGFCAISQASEIWAGVACFRSVQCFSKSTSARLWDKFSGVKRVSVLRKSLSANLVLSSMAPVRNPTPSGIQGTKPMPSSSQSVRSHL